MKLNALTSLVLAAGAAPCFAQVLLPPITRWSMPDFDQRRSGLANNGGMHCVPTAHCNILAYIADHGWPIVFPGVTQPTLASEYGEITDHIFDLGQMMGTTGANGTSGDGKREGFNEWMGVNLFLFNVSYQSGPDVTPTDLYFGLKGGGMVAFSYGRWEWSPGDGEYERNGGHCVTLRGIEGYRFPAQTGGWPTIKFRDPATDEGNVAGRLTGQSPFSTSVMEIRRFTSTFDYYGDDTFWELQTGLNDGKRRLIDGLTVVTPLIALQPDNPTNTVKIKSILALPDAPDEPGLTVNALTDAAMGLLPHQVFACGQFNSDQTLLVLGNPFTGGYSHTAFVPGGSGRVAVSPKNECYYVSGNLLRRYRPSDESGPLTQVGTAVTLPTTVSSIAFDDARGLLCLLMGDGSVREHGSDGAIIAVKTFSSPPTWPAAGAPANRRMVPAATPGEYWLGPLSGGQLRRYRPDPSVPTRLVPAEAVTPTPPPPGTTFSDFTITDRGTLLLKFGNTLQELIKLPTGQWVPDTASPLNGLNFPGNGALKISRSRRNVDPAAEARPGWQANIIDPPALGRQMSDCLADLGRTGGVAEPDGLLNNNDFIVYIDRFFALDPSADIGATGGIAGSDGLYNNNDFIVYIDRFFAGCDS